ncbi:MAG: GntR family transcriptional regulator, partial [Oscillospiraceae bacterium]|nr:GntR family transcriptional regulator [Oscillospiraceae bacterium]
MRIIINNQSMVPIYEQLVSQLKDMIINGALSDEEALPSVRSMSADLKISSLTVKKAYDLLEEEGF